MEAKREDQTCALKLKYVKGQNSAGKDGDVPACESGGNGCGYVRDGCPYGAAAGAQSPCECPRG